MRAHNLHVHGLMAALAVLLVIGVHVALAGVVIRLPSWVLLTAGAIGMAGLKYGWSRLRR